MTVTASDGKGNKATEDVVITVTNAIVLSVADASAAEGDGTLSFTVTASSAPSSDVTFKYTVTKEAADTATADTDFTAVATKTAGTIAANARTTTISVALLDDDLDESDETFTVTLSDASAGAAISGTAGTATGTITDDDASPVLTALADVTLRVGQTVDITASATDADTGDTITYAWTRKAGETTPALPGPPNLGQARLTFVPTATGTYTMTVTASDGTNEATEEVVITVTATASVSVPATLTVAEGAGNATLRITTEQAFGESVTFSASFAGGTATGASDPAGADYDNDAVSVTFGASDTTRDISIPITDDGLDESDETFTATIALAQGNTLPAGFALGNAATTVTITDDDASPVLAAIADESLRVGQTVDITASATDADTGDTISYVWTRKENEDTPAIPGSPNLNQARLTFVPTATGTYTMTVTASDGAGNSDTEEVVITVTPALGVTVTPTALTVVEGASATYTVKLNAEPSGNVTVTVAGATGDVSVTGSPLTFTDQNYGTAQTITVNAAADTDATNDAATLTHSATGGGYNGVTIANVDVTVTDTTPVLQLRKDPAAVTEGTAISLEVTSDKARTGTLAVSLTLAARGTAGFDADDIPGTLGPRNFNAVFGATPSTKGTVTIPTSSDSTAESAETYRITLNDTAAYELGADTTADGVLNDPAAGVSLSIADASAAENVSSGTLSFTVTASKASSSEVTFKYAVTAESGDTATAGTDFTAVAASAKGSGSIAANALTTTITVTLLDDNIEEADETFTVTLSEASGATISDATARGTIENDDTASLSIAAPSAVTEGDSSSMNMVFTVTLDSLSAQQVTVDYAVDAASTATSGTDHAALADGTLTFPAGTATQTVTVSVTGDERDEPDETVVIKLSNPENAVLGTATATGTITDDDASPSLTAIADVSYAVGQTVSVTASATDADNDPISYAWSRKAGETPAIPGSPNLNQAQLTFVPTAAGTYTMTVTASDGKGNKATEDVVITVTPAAATVSVPATLTVAEGGGNATVTITASRAFGEATTFNVSYGSTASTSDTDATGANAPADGDYDKDAVTSVQFGASDTTKDIAIPITDDAVVEGDETFTVTIAAAATLPSGFSLGNAATTVTITDDDTAGVTVSESSLTVAEGASNTYTVKLNAKPSGNVTVTVAGATGDVTVSGSPLTFTDQNYGTAQMITVNAASDTDATNDTATLTHSATGGGYNGVTIADVDVTVTDTTPVLQLSTDPSAVTEGADISLTVTSDKALTGTLDVSLTLADRGSSGFDADDIPGTLGPRTFTATFGNTASLTGTVTIPTSTDSDVEGAETYRITLNDTDDYELGTDTTADGTLNDGTTQVDPPARPTGLTAAAGNAQVVLTWTDPDDDDITGYKLRYAKTADRGDAEWNLISGSDGDTTTYTVSSLENGEEYSFKIRAVSAGGDGKATAWVKATPQAAAATVSVPATLTVAEGGGNATVRITASRAFGTETTINVTYDSTASTSDTDATGAAAPADGDYDNDAVTSVQFGASDTTKDIAIPITDDAVVEGDETFTVTIAAAATLPSGFTLGNAATTVTITDDDTAGVTVSESSLTVAEGASNTYTVKLNAKPSGNVTVTVAGATGDVTVSGSPLTFTDQNYGTAQTITVNAASDTDATNDTATLTHSATGGGYNGVTIAGVDVTVTDTTPVLQLSTDPSAVTEGTDISLTVTSDKALTGTLDVSLTLADRGSSGFDADDITGALGPRTFTATFGNTASLTGTVTIPTSTDSDVEGAETYRITLNDTDDYELGTDTTADGTLNDGTTQVDPPARPTGLTAAAGNGQVVLTWTDPDDDDITGYKLRYDKTGERRSASWNLISGSDGDTTTYTVSSLENGEEYSFKIRAVSAGGDGKATAWVTATPQAAAATVSVPATLTVAEGGGNATVRITASRAFGTETTINVTYGSTASTSDTDATGAANPADGDYDNDAVTSVTFGASDTTKDIAIPITDDAVAEGAETFTVTISAAATLPSGFSLGNATTTVTITDDDTPVTATVSVPATLTVAEGAGNAAVPITTGTAFGQSVTFNVTYSDSGATGAPDPANGDYDNDAVTSVTFTASDTTKTISIPITDDDAEESAETFTVTIAPAATLPTGFTLGNATTTVTITDNETVAPVEPEEPVVIEALKSARDLTLTPGIDRLTLDWTAPFDRNRAGWEMRFGKSTEVWSDWQLIADADATRYILTGLEAGTEYQVGLRPTDSREDQEPGYSISATGTTTANPPAKPANLTATAGNGQVTLTWDGADDDTITGWQWQQASDGDTWDAWTDMAVATAATTAYTVTNLTNGTEYQFRIRAQNPGGAGPESDVVRATPLEAKVSVPPALTVTEGMDSSVTVPITTTMAFGQSVQFDIRYGGTATGAADPSAGDYDNEAVTQVSFGSADTMQAIVIPLTDDGLDEAAETIEISIAPAAGSTLPSGFTLDNATTMVTITDDDASPVLAALADVNLTLGETLDLTAQATDADNDPLRYVWSRAEGETTPAIPDATNLTDARLTFAPPATGVYTMTVTAADGNGNTDSEPVTITVQVAAPAQPTNFAAEAGNGQVTLTWDAAADDSITGYQLRHGKTDERESTAWVTLSAAGAAATTHTVNGLDNGAEYSFALRAVNAGGEGTATDWVTAQPTAPGVTLSVPAQPTNFAAEAGIGQVMLTWDAAADDSITGYQLRYGKTDERESTAWVTLSAAGAAATTHTVTGLDNGTEYSFALRAVNAGGEGTATDWVTAQPTAPGVTLSVSALTIEEGSSEQYTLVLDVKPAGEVTLTVGGAAGDVSVTPARLVFTDTNWATSQTVMVRAAADEDQATDPAVTLTHTASGGGYEGAVIGNVRVTVTENPNGAREQIRQANQVNDDVLPQVIQALGSVSAVRMRMNLGAFGTPPVASMNAGSLSAGGGGLGGLGAQAGSMPGSPAGTLPGYGAGLAAAGGWLDGATSGAGMTTAGFGASQSFGMGRGAGAGMTTGMGLGYVSQPAGMGMGLATSTMHGLQHPGLMATAGPDGANGLQSQQRQHPGAKLSELFNGASFLMPLGEADSDSEAAGETDSKNPWSNAAIWGRAEKVSFSGSQDATRWDGGLWSTNLGADFRLRPNLLVGAALSYARSDADATVTTADGVQSVHETELTSLTPYGAWLLDDGSSLWASAGYGSGEVRIGVGESAVHSANLQVLNAAAGGNWFLSENTQWIAGGVTRLAIRGEAEIFHARTGAEDDLARLLVDTSRLRLALEGSHERQLANGATLTPAIEAGLRYDGGDVVAGAGLEVGASLIWRNPASGFLMEFRGRHLLTHARDRDEWGVSAMLRLDPAADGLGNFLTLSPSWGGVQTSIAQMFDARQPMAAFGAGSAMGPAGRLEAEYGYGFGFDRSGELAVLSPYTRLVMGEQGDRAYQLGVRYRRDSAVSLDIEIGHRQASPQQPAEKNLQLRGEYRW